MSVLQRIVSIGVREEYPEYIQSKVRLSNYLVLVGTLIALGYTVTYIFLFPPLVFYTLSATVAVLMAFVFNHFGWHRIARIVLTVIPAMLVGIIQGFAVGAGEPSTPSFMIFAGAMPILPWLLFDYRERLLLLLTSGFNVANILLLPWYNRQFESELDREFFTHPIFEAVLALSGLVTTALLLYILIKRNYDQERSNEQLFEDLESQKQALADHQNELKNTLDEIANARKEEQARAWVGAAVAKVNDLLRESESLEALYPALIRTVVTTLEAYQGVLYIRTEDEETKDVYLQCEASYAVRREDDVPKRVSDGEGQVGIAMSRKKMVVLDEVPEGYLHIASGLGQTKARQVVICPMITHGQVQGVVEIASLKPLSDAAMEYLNESTAIVASTLQNLRTNEKTRKLLKTSQLQSEEMRVQEEEMRQNVEELKATQEEMQRKEKDYVATIHELRNILTEKMYGKK